MLCEIWHLESATLLHNFYTFMKIITFIYKLKQNDEDQLY